MCVDWFSSPREPILGLFSPKTNSYLSKLVPWILKLRDIFAKTLAWFVSPWKSVRPIPVLRWGWWAVFQHGWLSRAPPSWILNSPPDWLKFVAAILDLENNRVYCSRNNSLLSFSAPDWLPSLWATFSSGVELCLRATTLIWLPCYYGHYSGLNKSSVWLFSYLKNPFTWSPC